MNKGMEVLTKGNKLLTESNISMNANMTSLTTSNNSLTKEMTALSSNTDLKLDTMWQNMTSELNKLINETKGTSTSMKKSMQEIKYIKGK